MRITYFENNRIVMFENLRQLVDEDGKRIYNEEILQELENGDFNCLNNMKLEDKNNKYFMEPLLYAVKNSKYNTYIIYQYYGEELQKQELTLATEIVLKEPEILEDTAITENDTIVLYLIQYNPEIILYISEDLKSNGEFIERIYDSGNKDAIILATRECDILEALQDNPSLGDNPEFMKAAIKEDITILSSANEELKNSHRFIKEVCAENKIAIEYIAEHTEEFGEEGLGAAKEVLVDNTTTKAIQELKEELKELENKENSEENQEIDIEKNKKEAAIKERQLRNSIKLLEKIKNGEVKPERAIRLINSLCKNLGEEYREEIMKYIKLDDAVIDKQKEGREKEKEGKIIRIEPGSVEGKVNSARLHEVQKEKDIVKEGIKGNREEELTEDID